LESTILHIVNLKIVLVSIAFGGVVVSKRKRNSKQSRHCIVSADSSNPNTVTATKGKIVKVVSYALTSTLTIIETQKPPII